MSNIFQLPSYMYSSFHIVRDYKQGGGVGWGGVGWGGVGWGGVGWHYTSKMTSIVLLY